MSGRPLRDGKSWLSIQLETGVSMYLIARSVGRMQGRRFLGSPFCDGIRVGGICILTYIAHALKKDGLARRRQEALTGAIV